MNSIIIMALPRSGSSMTAGLFSVHGVWTGICDEPRFSNKKGTFENKAIKKYLRSNHDDEILRLQLAQPKEDFHDHVLSVLKDEGCNGDWLFKGSALYWPMFESFDPKWVVCRRDKEATFRSCLAVNMRWQKKTEAELKQVIDFHHEQLDFLVAEKNAAEVDTESVAHGDYSTLRNALEHCGIEFDWQATDNFVDKSLWNYGSVRRTG